MAKFTRIETALAMSFTGMVPVFYHPDPEICKQVAKACYEGGARAFEFTNRGDFAHEVFTELHTWARHACPELILGAGSVVDPATTTLYLQLGANFIVSPILNVEMAKVCNRRKVLWIPGCGSLSEISYAEELGAEIVKIFPGASVGGPAFVKAIKGPLPWCSVMPTGGVEPTKENLTAWFHAGVTCVGMGSNLFPAEVIASGEWHHIRDKTSEVLDIISTLRSNSPSR